MSKLHIILVLSLGIFLVSKVASNPVAQGFVFPTDGDEGEHDGDEAVSRASEDKDEIVNRPPTKEPKDEEENNENEEDEPQTRVVFGGPTDADDDENDFEGHEEEEDDQEEEDVDFLIPVRVVDGTGVAPLRNEGDDEEEETPSIFPIADDEAVVVDNDDLPDDVIECSEDFNALPWFDPLTREHSCHFLTTQGPCPEEDMWFVLDEQLDADGNPQGVCKLRECDVDFVKIGGECALVGDTSKCAGGMEVLINPFGQGECDCRDEYLPHTDEKGILKCYQRNLQGPCDDDQQYVDISNNAELLESHPNGAVCVGNPCEGEGEISWDGGVCLKSVECDNDDKMVILDAGELKCLGVRLRQILNVEKVCPSGESLNHEGECKRVVRFGGGANKRPPRRLATRRLSLHRFMKKRFGKK